jgi:translation initiation factor IF-2
LLEEKKFKAEETSAEEAITTQYQKLSGTKLTGRLLICLSLINRKKKKREPKITLISRFGAAES